MQFVICPKQGREMEAAVLHRVGDLAYSCPKQGQDFQPSAAPLYPNMGQVSPGSVSCLEYKRKYLAASWIKAGKLIRCAARLCDLMD